MQASSPGLAAATLTINAKSVGLRPQVAVWERKVPQGNGITGLWRPERESAAELIILSQEGSTVSGSAEGFSGSWAGGNDCATPIPEGSIEGNKVNFRIGAVTYSGTVDGDRMELVRPPGTNARSFPNPLKLAAESLAIGPAPDGSDPSRSPIARHEPNQPFVLSRVKQ